MKYFLDTNICIYFLKGAYSSIAENLRLQKPENIKIPAIVKAELLYGAEKSVKREENFRNIEAFLEPYEIMAFDNDAACVYSGIRAETERKGKNIGPNDLLIAAIVIANNGNLVTGNKEE